jgi:hypothetical protein
MHKKCAAVDASMALNYMGKTVLMELAWECDSETVWRLMQIVGVVLPYEGTFPHGHFLIVPLSNKTKYPDEVFFSSIRTIRVVG